MTAKRILIVEDEKAIRDMVAFGLRRAGYEVREAEDCREARARIVDVLSSLWSSRGRRRAMNPKCPPCSTATRCKCGFSRNAG